MKLTQEKLNKVVSILIEELAEANDNGELCEYLKRHKYCQMISDSCAECFVKNGQKILVVGDTRIGRNIMEEIACDNCIEFEDIEIIDDYAKMTNTNFDLILKSGKYSDIIVGPNPHMVKGLKGNNSLIAKLIRGENTLVHTIITKNMKITADSFKKALLETNYYKSMCL